MKTMSDLLRKILDARIKELSSVQHFWTGKTPRHVIEKAIKELEDTKRLKQLLLGDD